MNRRERRTRRRQENWVVVFGLLMGIVIGLLFAWIISPVSLINVAPRHLDTAYRDAYRLLIAQAFAANKDTGRAASRLALLQDEVPAQALLTQARTAPTTEAPALVALSEALIRPVGTQITPTPQPGSPTPIKTAIPPTATLDPAVVIRTPTLPPSPTVTITPTITLTPQPTFTPRASITSLPTLAAPFILKEKKETCDAALPGGLLQVELFDPTNKPLPGVRINITWPGGEDSFYTGLYPEIHAGYADFVMTNSITYSLRPGDSSDAVTGLSTHTCSGGLVGGIKLVFVQR